MVGDLKIKRLTKSGRAKGSVMAIIEFPITFPIEIYGSPFKAATIDAIDSSGSIPKTNIPIIKGDNLKIRQTSFKLSIKKSAAKKMIK